MTLLFSSTFSVIEDHRVISFGYLVQTIFKLSLYSLYFTLLLWYFEKLHWWHIIRQCFFSFTPVFLDFNLPRLKWIYFESNYIIIQGGYINTGFVSQFFWHYH